MFKAMAKDPGVNAACDNFRVRMLCKTNEEIISFAVRYWLLRVGMLVLTVIALGNLLRA